MTSLSPSVLCFAPLPRHGCCYLHRQRCVRTGICSFLVAVVCGLLAVVRQYPRYFSRGFQSFYFATWILRRFATGGAFKPRWGESLRCDPQVETAREGARLGECSVAATENKTKPCTHICHGALGARRTNEATLKRPVLRQTQ